MYIYQIFKKFSECLGIVFYTFLQLYMFYKLKIKPKLGFKQEGWTSAIKHSRGSLSKPSRAGIVGVWENKPRPQSLERTEVGGELCSNQFILICFSSLLPRLHKCFLFNDFTSWSHSTHLAQMFHSYLVII